MSQVCLGRRRMKRQYEFISFSLFPLVSTISPLIDLTNPLLLDHLPISPPPPTPPQQFQHLTSPIDLTSFTKTPSTPQTKQYQSYCHTGLLSPHMMQFPPAPWFFFSFLFFFFILLLLFIILGQGCLEGR